MSIRVSWAPYDSRTNVFSCNHCDEQWFCYNGMEQMGLMFLKLYNHECEESNVKSDNDV